ncbi:MAG: hypothetical protein ACJA1A_002667 [Saprospiraceae bacterium]|jgi:hypothetical protein|tara:strand:- start:1026 stop:1328 length:303 start_codon:yes stop_codon:yes gene_type:complete
MKLDRVLPLPYLDFFQSHFEKAKKKKSDEDIMEIMECCNYRTVNIQKVMNRLDNLEEKKLCDAEVRMAKETILKEDGEIYHTIRRLVTSGQWEVIESFAK